MKCELRQVLGDERDHPRVVRSRADFGEQHRVADDEQLDAEQAPAPERVGDLLSHVLRSCQRRCRQSGRLPGLAVVAVHLYVPDRVDERRTARVTHGQQRDLRVERHEAFDDAAATARATTLLRVPPDLGDLLRRAQHRLALARRGHDRLHDAREPDCFGGDGQLGLGVDEAVRGRGEAELLGGQPPDPLAVHRELCRACRRHDPYARRLHIREDCRRDGLDLGNDDVRPLEVDHRPQRDRVEHVDDVRAMGDLHGRGIRVPVDRDDLDAEALELDRDLLAQLAGTEQQHARGGRGQRGTDLDAVHGFIQPLPAPPVPWACRLVP